MKKPSEAIDAFLVHSVPVFQKDLAAVFKLLSDRNRVGDAHGSVARSVTPGPEDDWTESNLVALHEWCKPIHRAILSRMAEAGTVQKSATYEDLRVSAARVSRNSDFDYDNMRGNLAWISKYMIKVTGSKTGLFLFTDKGAELKTGERYEYRMSKATADAWLRIARSR